MKNFKIALLAGSLLLSPCFAQTADDISMGQFREALTDFLSLSGNQSAITAANLLTTVPDSVLAKWYVGVPNGRRFYNAVAVLKTNRNTPNRTPVGGAVPATVGDRRVPARPTFSAQASSFAGIASTVVPDLTLPDQVFPSGASWAALVGPLQSIGAIAAGDPSNQRCTADSAAAFSVAYSTFLGIKTVAEAICNAIPDITVIILGEGTSVPLKEACFIVNLVLTPFTAATEGYNAGCNAQQTFVNDARNGAIYANSISIFNFEYRLMVEENLGNTLAPMGLFALPASQGGYLENVRAIVADTIANMVAAGQNVGTANTSLLAGDTNYNAGRFKQAYKTYQTAYNLAVK
jgi:hypothetical protein